jgi:hypothetical protein
MKETSMKANESTPPMLKWALRELLGTLPERRDWFNPDAEKIMREYVNAPATPAAPAALQAAIDEVAGCFRAAEVEGLSTALAETSDERLKDLIERRLMHALYAVQGAASAAAPAAPSELPAILFDGKAVYDEVQAHAACKTKTSAENVSDVLDAVVRLMRKEGAAPAAEQAQDEVRDRVRNAVAQALTCVYFCGRSWSAWSHGTMHEDDFTPAGEVDEVLDEIVDAALGAMKRPATGGAA